MAPRRDDRHGAARGPASGVRSARTAARHDAVLDLTVGELFERARRELLLVRRARYLLAACFDTSDGVKTCMRQSSSLKT